MKWKNGFFAQAKKHMEHRSERRRILFDFQLEADRIKHNDYPVPTYDRFRSIIVSFP